MRTSTDRAETTSRVQNGGDARLDHLNGTSRADWTGSGNGWATQWSPPAGLEERDDGR